MERITLDTPKIITKTIVYTEFMIKDIKIELNKKASFIIILFGDETDVMDIEMTEAEYAIWSDDDNYVIQFIKNKLLE